MSSMNASLTPLFKQESTSVSVVLASHTTTKQNKLKHCSQNTITYHTYYTLALTHTPKSST